MWSITGGRGIDNDDTLINLEIENIYPSKDTESVISVELDVYGQVTQ